MPDFKNDDSFEIFVFCPAANTLIQLRHIWMEKYRSIISTNNTCNKSAQFDELVMFLMTAHCAYSIKAWLIKIKIFILRLSLTLCKIKLIAGIKTLSRPATLHDERLERMSANSSLCYNVERSIMVKKSPHICGNTICRPSITMFYN